MAFITREDGEHFVIPSYRDILSAKKPSLLKKEILLLSSDYGEYITLQRKSLNQYEVAFSTEPGYLLGESVWNYFKRPNDLIYCEALPNGYDAILVIVKNGSVYLDGSFPIESIPEELLIFRTQQNNFEVYIYGDVPISESPEEGKFAFDPASVKSFTHLDTPAFPNLPLVKAFQLQLVDTVLKAQRIGVFPTSQLLTLLGLLVLAWLAWKFFTAERAVPEAPVVVVNPYQQYLNQLSTPDPSTQVRQIANRIPTLYSISGWTPDAVDYAAGVLSASMKSAGTRTSILFDWAARNNANIEVLSDGFHLSIPMTITGRTPPDTINPLSGVIANLADRLSYVIVGNPLVIGNVVDKGQFLERQLTINFSNISPTTLDLIGQQLKNLPLVLSKVNMKVSQGNLTGSISLTALGS